MVLKSEFNEKRNEMCRIYLETFPYKVSDKDFGIILDTAYDKSKSWIQSIKWLPRGKKDNILKYFASGGRIWITDIDNNTKELTREIMINGIGMILKKDIEGLVDYRNELNTPCFSEIICDGILQYSLYGEKRF